MDAHGMLAVALEQARIGFAEGGVPVGGAIFHTDGTLLGAGRNRLVQERLSAWRNRCISRIGPSAYLA